MIVFEVSYNGQRLCTAAVGQHGVLTAMVTWTSRGPATVAAVSPEHHEDAARDELRLEVGGLSDRTHHKWPSAVLKPGDEVLVRLCETTAADALSNSHKQDPDYDLAANRDYVRRMCQQWGWHLTES